MPSNATPDPARRNPEQHRRDVLALLRDDASRSQSDIAATVGVNVSTVSRIISALEAEGLRRVAYMQSDQSLELVIVEVQLKESNTEEKNRLFAHFKRQPEILECFAVSGDALDFVLLLAGGSAAYGAWFNALPSGIQDVRSHPVFERLRGIRAI